MTRYFFDLVDNDGLVEDDEGLELSSEGAARLRQPNLWPIWPETPCMALASRLISRCPLKCEISQVRSCTSDLISKSKS